MNRFDMGRTIIQIDEGEYWITESHSGYDYRVSIAFKSMEELFDTLKKGGLKNEILNTLRKKRHVASMAYGEVNGKTVFVSLSTEVDEALHKMDALCPYGDFSLYEDGSCVGCGGHIFISTEYNRNEDGFDETLCSECF